MDDNYLLPEHLKKIFSKEISESPQVEKDEKFADRKSIIDEKEMIKIVNLFTK